MVCFKRHRVLSVYSTDSDLLQRCLRNVAKNSLTKSSSNVTLFSILTMLLPT